MGNNIIINPEKNQTSILNNVVDAKTASDILGIKNRADLNKAAKQGFIPYVTIGTAYCYDRNALETGWAEYQLHAVQPFKVDLTSETINLYKELREGNQLTDEQIFKHFFSLLKRNQ